MGQQAKIYVDATGFVALHGAVLTGIPRVEDFVIRAAVLDADPAVEPVVFDRALMAYRRMMDVEYRALARISRAVAGTEAPRQGLLAQLRWALCTVRANPFLGKEFERQVAARIAGRRRRGATYVLLKCAIRAYRYGYHLGFHLRRLLGAFRRHLIDDSNAIVLISNMAMLGRASPCGATRGARAFICYDLIPVLHGELASSDRLAQTFRQRITALMRDGALAICISASTRSALERYVAGELDRAGRVARMPMPSMLYHKARALGLSGRLAAAEPFVLCCSTVEVRKNHLMLLRIWMQAAAEGVALPKLVCAGSWGWKTQPLHDYLEAHPHLLRHVAFLGAVDDRELIDLYRSAQFGVMPSRAEGWGLGASECLDFGTPVIVSTAPALVEATRGLMPAIDPDDEAGWYAAVRRLAADHAELARLRAAIAAGYRPVGVDESWRAIKAALRSQPLRGAQNVASVATEVAGPLRASSGGTATLVRED